MGLYCELCKKNTSHDEAVWLSKTKVDMDCQKMTLTRSFCKECAGELKKAREEKYDE